MPCPLLSPGEGRTERERGGEGREVRGVKRERETDRHRDFREGETRVCRS